MADRKRLIHYFTGYAGGVSLNMRRNGDRILTSDDERLLPTKAPVSLSSMGGWSRAETGDVGFDDVLSVLYVLSEARGDFQPVKSAARYTRGNWKDNQLPAVTTVTSTVQGTVIRNGERKVEFDNVYFKLTGTTKVENGDVPGITAEVKIDGFRIDGAPLRVKFAPREFLQVPDFDSFRQRCNADAKFLERYGSFLIPPDSFQTPEAPPKRLPNSRYVVCTVVDSIKWDTTEHPDDVQWLGRNRLYIPGWGTLIVGELRMHSGLKQIAMVRAELGSPWGGDLEIAFGGENGSGWPP